ncbi:hypothetical protein UPYG_G00064700 [Umbra pygmaea]|uniref:Uncharacterized protein n=1 Tax=Umbra pygmaea TaxID=75934 RepID=A0ABD0XZL3_UMBPY
MIKLHWLVGRFLSLFMFSMCSRRKMAVMFGYSLRLSPISCLLIGVTICFLSTKAAPEGTSSPTETIWQHKQVPQEMQVQHKHVHKQARHFFVPRLHKHAPVEATTSVVTEQSTPVNANGSHELPAEITGYNSSATVVSGPDTLWRTSGSRALPEETGQNASATVVTRPKASEGTGRNASELINSTISAAEEASNNASAFVMSGSESSLAAASGSGSSSAAASGSGASLTKKSGFESSGGSARFWVPAAAASGSGAFPGSSSGASAAVSGTSRSVAAAEAKRNHASAVVMSGSRMKGKLLGGV